MKNIRIVYILALIICLVAIVSSNSMQLRNEAEMFKVAALLVVVFCGLKSKNK